MLSSSDNKVIYDITGLSVPISTGYEIPFRIFEAADVYVTIALASGENVAIKTGWSVLIPSSDTGVCKVIFDEDYSFPETASKLIIYREVAIKQTVDLRNGDTVEAEILEEMADKLTAIAQQLKESLSRSFKLPISETPEDLVFPGEEERAGKIIGFDETGQQVVLYESLDKAVDRAEAAAEVSQEAADKADQAADHLDEILAMRKAFEATIGDGTSKVFVIEHNLNTWNFVPAVWASANNLPPLYTMRKLDPNHIQLTFEEAPPAGSVSLVLSAVDKAYITKMKWDDIEDVQITADQISPSSIATEADVDKAFGIANTQAARTYVIRRKRI